MYLCKQIILADKDERIKDLQLQVAKYRDDLAMSNIDTNKATISNLTKVMFLFLFVHIDCRVLGIVLQITDHKLIKLA